MDNTNQTNQNDLVVPENDIVAVENDIVEAKQENSDTNTQNKTENNEASQFLDLDGVIKRSASGIEKLKQDLKIQKDMLDSAFLNDSVFQEHDRLVKEATKTRTATKQQISKQPNIAQVIEKINSLREDLKSLQQSLSSALAQYQKMTGATQIELDDGSVMEIVSTVKLVKKSAEFRP